MKKLFLVILIIFLTFPLNSVLGVAKEEIIINEVMWGKDSDDEEWIELRNLTSNTITLDSWVIDNAKSANKPLENIKGMIPADGYFLICEKDSAKNCDFYGSISLKDTCSNNKCNGDLILRDDKKTIIDIAPGNPWPIGGEGKSMQREFKDSSPLDSWIEGNPLSPQSSGVSLSANAGSNIISLTKKEIIFDGSASTGNIDEYFWNFGEGNTAKGKVVSHKYEFPGKYLVSLEVSNPRKKSEAVIEVSIFSNSVFISEFSLKEEWIEIINESENI